MVDRNRKLKSDRETIGLNYCAIDDAIAKLQGWKLDHPNYKNASVEIYEEYDCYDIYIEYLRDETDKEMKDRIAREEEYEKKNAADDLATYERLKKKFEG